MLFCLFFCYGRIRKFILLVRYSGIIINCVAPCCLMYSGWVGGWMGRSPTVKYIKSTHGDDGCVRIHLNTVWQSYIII